MSHPSCNQTKSDDAFSADIDRWLDALNAYEAFHGVRLL